MPRTFWPLTLLIAFVAAELQAAPPKPKKHDYDIVYVRAARYGDDKNTRWPEVKDPIQMEPGADLMLLHPDGTQEVLVKGGNGSVVDPFVSFDGEWVYYAYFHDLRPEALNRQRRQASRAGSDLYKIHVASRKIVRLTHQEFTPNTGVADWSPNPAKAEKQGQVFLGYGVFNLGPCPLPGGKIIFTSSRNGYMPNKSYTFPNLQLFVMDDDGSNVELVGHMNLGSALHPTVLRDGRVMFSSYEAQGLRDQRIWGLWAIQPDGRAWEPLVSAFANPFAMHFQTQTTDGNIVVESYYNQNNNGFGSLWSLPPRPPSKGAPFGDPNPRHVSNPRLPQGWFRNNKTNYYSMSFSPKGLRAVTEFTTPSDRASVQTPDGEHTGKVTHPSGAPNNDLLLVWSGGPANNLARPVRTPYYDGGLYRLVGGKPAKTHKDLVLILNDPKYNEMQPRALVPYRDIYGVAEPKELPWLPNDGGAHRELPAGTPFGLVGTSSFFKRNTSPGRGSKAFDGLDPFNTRQNGASTNWSSQGADAGKYTNDDIHAVRILAMEPSSHFSYGLWMGFGGKNWYNHANERLRILGEIPLRKSGPDGKPILDPDGNPDTSFLAKIPADVPFTFQTLDRNGMVLNASQTWHQVRPGEVRYNCGGCHAHAQEATDFTLTAAFAKDYAIPDLTTGATLLTAADSGPTMTKQKDGAVDVEYYRDIKPILERSCVQCHSKEGDAKAGLVLDDEKLNSGYDGTYHRLANDPRGDYGPKPLIGAWRQTNASRYIRKFQSRRSLLMWKLFGKRLDGWSNDDHPTAKVAGDPKTLPKGANPNDADLDFTGTIMPPPDAKVPPLTADEKRTFARWIDLGCPISRNEDGFKEHGWFLDELRPTLTVSAPRAGTIARLDRIVVGMHDYYSGLAPKTFRVTANVALDGVPADTDLSSRFTPTHRGVWEYRLETPLTETERVVLTVHVADKQGNETRIDRTFTIVK